MLGWFRRNGRDRTFEYQCSCCGEVHRGSPVIAYHRPEPYFDVPEDERETRVKIDHDLCKIAPPADEPGLPASYFIRTTLDVPIHGADEPFSWGVWVSQSEKSFWRYVETYDGDQSGMSSFGWLLAAMPGYKRFDAEGSLGSVPCDVFWQANGQRPRLEVHECDHPLYIDQRDGISWDRAIELAQQAVHQT